MKDYDEEKDPITIAYRKANRDTMKELFGRPATRETHHWLVTQLNDALYVYYNAGGKLADDLGKPIDTFDEIVLYVHFYPSSAIDCEGKNDVSIVFARKGRPN